MGWMKVKKLKLNCDKMGVLLVGSSLVMGSNCIPWLAGVALTFKASIRSLEVLLDPWSATWCPGDSQGQGGLITP